MPCSTCYTVKLPSCFDAIVLTLAASTSYDAVFTNHFGKKKVIEVISDADGSISISADEFDEGYFTPFNSVTLEFFRKSSGGYSGYDTENATGCEAVTVCENYQCFTLEFYESDHVDAATVKCCEENYDDDEKTCCESHELLTIGDLIPIHQSAIDKGLFVFYVITNNASSGDLNTLSYVLNFSELPLWLLELLPPDTPIGEFIGGDFGDDTIFRYLICTDNMFGLIALPFDPGPAVQVRVTQSCSDLCLPGLVRVTIEVAYGNLPEGEQIVIHGAVAGTENTLIWNVNNPTNSGNAEQDWCVENGSEFTLYAEIPSKIFEEESYEALTDCP